MNIRETPVDIRNVELSFVPSKVLAAEMHDRRFESHDVGDEWIDGSGVSRCV